MNYWRAGCRESGKPGSEGGRWKRTATYLASGLPYYLDTWDLRTPAAILPRYAPPGDGNDPAAYSASVIQLVDGWTR